MHLPVLLQHERALPGEELETVPACLRDQLAQPARRQVADAGSRMHADAEQHLVLDDVAHAGEYLLVQQRIADLCGGRGLEPAAGQGRVPAIAHHVRAPVVHLVQRLLDEHHRARIDVELAVVEAQRHPGGCRLALVDQPAAEHHQVDAQAEVVEFQQEVLAPAAHGPHPAAVHARQRLAGVAADLAHGAAGEPPGRLTQQHDRRPFRHGTHRTSGQQVRTLTPSACDGRTAPDGEEWVVTWALLMRSGHRPIAFVMRR